MDSITKVVPTRIQQLFTFIVSDCIRTPALLYTLEYPSSKSTSNPSTTPSLTPTDIINSMKNDIGAMTTVNPNNHEDQQQQDIEGISNAEEL